ncbi:MAG: ABC transporter ATP-binding protein [Acidobacteriota bacterium]
MVRITAKDVTVEFPVYGSRLFKSAFINTATGGRLLKGARDRVVVKALNKVSFEFVEGDRVGLMGPNGSGKTTLLRVLAGAFEPVSGTAVVEGSLTCMLGIWLGMDMDATGYENIYMRSTLMGLSRREIEPHVPEIVEFCELGDYLSMPLRTYSSGMGLRLAFAISTSVPADVLLMDEWMSVGDSSFSAKAEGRLRRLIDQARILVVASHSENLVRSICNKVVHLSHGEITHIEETRPA